MKIIVTSLLFCLPLFLFSQSHPEVIAAYKFLEGTPENADGDRYHGTFVDDPIPVPDRFGQPANALYMDGVDDYIDIGYDLELGTGDFSVEVWCYNRTVYPPDGNMILSDGISVHNTPRRAGHAINFKNDNGNRLLRFIVGGADDHLVILSYNDTPINEWMHIVGVRQGTEIKLFVNGELVDTQYANAVQDLTNNVPLSIGVLNRAGTGGSRDQDQFFNGVVDLVRYYNRPLNMEEVDALYKAESDDLPNIFNHPCQNAVVCYPLDGDAFDESGNAHHGTVMGALSATDATGVPGTALEFDGINDGVEVGDVFELGTSDFTIEAKFMPYSVDIEPGNQILVKGTSIYTTPSRAGYSLKVRRDNGVNKLVFNIGDGDGGLHSITTDVLLMNAWNNVAIIRQGKNIQLWHNGNLAGEIETVIKGDTDSNFPFAIGFLDRGEFGSTDEYFHGKISHVKIYRTAMAIEDLAVEFSDANASLSQSFLETSISNVENKIVVDWKAFYPDAISYTLLESTDGINFNEQSTFVLSENNQYQYVETEPNCGQNYYRIIVNFADNRTLESDILQHHWRGINLNYAADGSNQLHIQSSCYDETERSKYSIINSIGKTMARIRATNGDVINVDYLPSGIYYLKNRMNEDVLPFRVVH